MEDQLCRPERHIEMTLCLNIMFGFSLKIAPLNLLAFLFFQIFRQTRFFCHCWLAGYSRHFCHNRSSSRDHIWHPNLIFVRFATFINVSTLQGYLL